MKSLWMVCLLLACEKHDTEKSTLSTDPSASAASASAPEAKSAVAAPLASSDTRGAPASDAAPGAFVASRPTSPTSPTASASAIASAVSSVSSTARGAGFHVDGEHFAVDVAAPSACARNVECKVPIRLTAKDDFHVNQEYPYKIKLDDVPGATFAGRDAAGPSTFSKSAGDFAFEGEKTGVMTVRFTATQPGVVPLSGTLKLSVCNASNCKLETAQVKATVPIS